MNRIDAYLVAAVAILFLVARAYAQSAFELPDAPSRNPDDRNPAELKLSQTQLRWWQKRYEPQAEPWSKVFSEPFLYVNTVVDAALAFSDTHYSEQAYDRGCREVSPPVRPSGSYLKRDNAIEVASVFGVTMLWFKVKGMKKIAPFFLTAPVIIHGRGIYHAQNCQ